MNHIYVGPVVTFMARTKEVKYKVRGCAKCKTPSDSLTSKFCSKCGTKFSIFTTEETSFVSHIDVLGEDESLHKVNDVNINSKFIVLADNSKGSSLVDYHSNPYLDLMTIDMQEEINFFSEKFAKQISILKDNFDNVKVTFGVYTYYL